MHDLAADPVTKRWPVRTPGAMLYSFPTPDAVKVSIALAEIGLAHAAHLVDFCKNDQTSPAFPSLNPDNKIPAVIDPDGPGRKPVVLFVSGAIQIHRGDVGPAWLFSRHGGQGVRRSAPERTLSRRGRAADQGAGDGTERA